MNIYCTQHFVDAIKKLERNSSYAAITADVCHFLQDKNIAAGERSLFFEDRREEFFVTKKMVKE